MRQLYDILLILSITMVYVGALPTSLVNEIKEKGASRRNVKVKRAHNEQVRDDIGYYNKPTAIKRGINRWDSPQYSPSIYPDNTDVFNDLKSSLYNNDDGINDKSLMEYEKGYRYGTNREHLDEALQNAVLKSEIYGEPTAINQYRYYGMDDKRKRRRRDLRKTDLNDLTPDEILTLLTLYESHKYRQHAPLTENNLNEGGVFGDLAPSNLMDVNNDEDNTSDYDGEESWLDGPVALNPYTARKRGRWGAFIGPHKRAPQPMGSDNYYTLNELLGNRRASNNVPIYHRLVL